MLNHGVRSEMFFVGLKKAHVLLFFLLANTRQHIPFCTVLNKTQAQTNTDIHKHRHRHKHRCRHRHKHIHTHTHTSNDADAKALVSKHVKALGYNF